MMLPSNNSKPWEKLRNSTNIIDLLDFPKCPLVNLISKNALQLFFYVILVDNV
jgi:hypothetical protein